MKIQENAFRNWVEKNDLPLTNYAKVLFLRLLKKYNSVDNFPEVTRGATPNSILVREHKMKESRLREIIKEEIENLKEGTSVNSISEIIPFFQEFLNQYAEPYPGSMTNDFAAKQLSKVLTKTWRQLVKGEIASWKKGKQAWIKMDDDPNDEERWNEINNALKGAEKLSFIVKIG